jgi:hypothetical protein
MPETARDDLVLYFQRNGERLAQFYEARARLPFCWPGLLFPQAWFLYRKMYLWAALVSAGPLLLAYAPKLGVLEWATSLLGAMGLRFYFLQAETTIARIRAAAQDEDEARALIAKAGGVSLTGACVGAGFIFAAFVLTLKAPHALGLR